VAEGEVGEDLPDDRGIVQLMAGALLGSIPVALIYSFFVKYYVAGLTAGAVKG
jgi:ABC-type maltose transport system permease subunit